MRDVLEPLPTDTERGKGARVAEQDLFLSMYVKS